ncbi:MAG: hypothetical protein AB1543_06830, partial [Candidatus Bipolaricaulota bacterium]
SHPVCQCLLREDEDREPHVRRLVGPMRSTASRSSIAHLQALLSKKLDYIRGYGRIHLFLRAKLTVPPRDPRKNEYISVLRPRRC